MNDDFTQFGLENESVKNDYYCYECSTCHTIFQSFESLNNCVFCGETTITKTDSKNYDDVSYLNFSVSSDEAFSLYKKLIRFNFLIPFALRSRSIRKKIHKVYLPCLLSDYTVDGNISFYGVDKINTLKNSPKQMFECLYTTHFDYSNLLSSNFSKINDALLSNINNYDFSSLSSFDPAMTKDSCLIVSNINNTETTEKVKERALNRCINIVKENVKHEKKKLAENNLTMETTSSKQVMIPIYFMNYRCSGQDYILLINGQTKKVICDLPTSIISIVILSVICFVIILLISCCIVLFL